MAHSQTTPQTTGAILLCGGRSQRMGTSKAELRFGNDTALQRVIQASQAVAEHLIVVGAASTDWTALPESVPYVVDNTPFPGPLAALLQGFESLPDCVDRAFLLSCDLPLVAPRFLKQLQHRHQNQQIVVVEFDHYLQPFPAMYHRSVVNVIRQQLAEGERSLQALLRNCDTEVIPAETLRKIDPQLLSLRQMNTPSEYQELLQQFAQLASDEEQVD